MSNKELIIRTIDYLKKQDADGKSYTDMLTSSVWSDLTSEKKSELRTILLRNKLIRHHTDNLWQFQLTSESLLLNLSEIDDNGNISPEAKIKQQESEIDFLNKEVLRLTIKSHKWKIPFAIISFLSGAIITIVAPHAGRWLWETTESNKEPKQQIEILLHLPKGSVDTTVVIYKDTLK